MAARKRLGGLAKKRACKAFQGKIAISAAGKKRLQHLRDVQSLRLSRIVRAVKPTDARKNVLFVCPAGMESSLLGMKQF